MGYQQNPYRILRNANESSSDNNASSNPHPECQREQRLRKVIQKGGPKSLSKQIMRTINSCNHGSLLSGGLQESTDRCINCYLRDGKAKKRAWACQHKEKLHYGKGLCNNCYHLAYYHKRRAALAADERREHIERHPSFPS